MPRHFDGRLRDLITRGVESGCFVVLMGGSSCGKTRSLYEAVSDLVPEWWLVQPTRTQDIQDLLRMPTERTVLWLDELHRFFGADPPLRKADVVALVRAGTIVVGTLWPDHYHPRKRLFYGGGGGGDVYADDRLLLDFAEVVPVAEKLTAEEMLRAGDLAKKDSRIQAALKVTDVGLTQVLAAGPDLVNLWEQAPDPYSKAILSAAADARRLGVASPLPASVLTEAMAGYLSPAHRVQPPRSWLEHALGHATGQLHGSVSALTPVADERGGSVEGYEIADYLAQHIGRVRRCECPPHSLWTALASTPLNSGDLRRLASAALARMRYRYAEPVLRQLQRAGDPDAATELITLLRGQDRLGDAMEVADAWLAADPTDQRRRGARADLIRLLDRADQLRKRAAADPRAAELLVELLADGGRADAIRARAAAGNVLAAEDLVDQLANDGRLDELRTIADGGHRFASDRLAELLANLGRIDELRQRALRGDPAAALHRARLERREPSDTAELAGLRAAADGGDEEAAGELTSRLFDLGDRAGLLAELNAGTNLAAARYLALLTADPAMDRDELRAVRGFGLRADGRPGEPGPENRDRRSDDLP